MKVFLIGYPIAVLIAVLGVVAAQFDYSEVDWPAWVQAVGSIAAIIGAYGVGERQAKAAAKTAENMGKHAEKKKQAAYLAIATVARDYIHDISKSFYPNQVDKLRLFITYDEKIGGDLISAMSAVPVHELGSADSVKAWVATKNAMLYFQRAIVFYVEQVNNDLGGESEDRPGNPAGVLQCANHAKACYGYLESVMSKG